MKMFRIFLKLQKFTPPLLVTNKELFCGFPKTVILYYTFFSLQSLILDTKMSKSSHLSLID